MNTPEYNAWVNMKQRCYNKNHPEYFRYGGRGIEVCEDWLTSYKNFLEDMGVRPSTGHSIDREKNELGYTKDNCRWVDKTTQSYNQRLSSDNKSGIVGVSWYQRVNSWRVFISKNGKQINLGYTKDFFEACCRRKRAENTYYGD